MKDSSSNTVFDMNSGTGLYLKCDYQTEGKSYLYDDLIISDGTNLANTKFKVDVSASLVEVSGDQTISNNLTASNTIQTNDLIVSNSVQLPVIEEANITSLTIGGLNYIGSETLTFDEVNITTLNVDNLNYDFGEFSVDNLTLPSSG